MELGQQYRVDTKVKRFVLSPWLWALCCFFLFGYPIVKSVSRKLPPPNPVLYKLPEYKMVNQYGHSFGSSELRGKHYIVNFFFSSCPTVCPELMEQMQAIQHRVRGLGTHVALVSITVDPQRDQPPKLFLESRKYRANPHIWFFLTGEKERLRELVSAGFKLPVSDARPYGDDGILYDIAHSQKLVLVDDQGGIRGFYSVDKPGVNQLMIDLGLLVNRRTHGKQSKES